MSLVVQHIHKRFGEEVVLLNLSLEVPEGLTLAVVGRSGCGKTTFLRILAGLETPDEGTIQLSGKDLGDTPAHMRNMVYVYQEPLLFPHLNVFENIAFGLRIRNRPEPEVRQRVGDILEELGLQGLAAKRSHELSGGQAQRVAFGRALVIEPTVLLLDEPFGKLDVDTRQQMQALFQRVTQKRQITTLFVTHDLKEALRLGDRLGYMEKGNITLFQDVAAFMEDERTGARAERQFWESLGEQGKST